MGKKLQAVPTNGNESSSDIEAMYQKALEKRISSCNEEIQEVLAKHRCNLIVGFQTQGGFISAEQIMKLQPAWALSPKG